MQSLHKSAAYSFLSLGLAFCIGCGGKPPAAVDGPPARPPSEQDVSELAGDPDSGTASLPAAARVAKQSLATLRPIARSGVSRYSPDGKWFVIGSDELRVFDVARRACVDVIPVSKHQLVALDFSADGDRIAAGYWNFEPQDKPEIRGFEVVILSFPEGQELKRFAGLPGHANSRRRLAFSPDGKLLADGYAKTVQVRDIESGEVRWEVTEADLKVPGHSYASFDVTPDWKYFLINLQRVSYPSKETIPMVKFLDQERPFFWQNLISPDGKLAAAMGGPNGSIQKLFELETGTLIHEVTEAPSQSLTATPDFKRFVNAQGYWDGEDGAQHKLPGNAGSAAFTRWTSVSPDGKEATVGGSYFRFEDVRGEADDKAVKGWGDTAFINRPLDVDFDELGLPLIQASSKQRSINLESGGIGEIQKAPSRSMFANELTKFGTFPRATSPNKEFTCDKVGWLNNPGEQFKKYIFEGDDAKTRPKSGQPFFPDNQTLVFLGGGKAYVFNTAGELQHAVEFPRRDETAMIVSSSDAKVIAVSQGSWRTGHRRYVSIVNIAEGKVLMPAVELGRCDIKMSAGGKYLAAIGTKWVNVYLAATGALAHELRLTSGNASKSTVDPQRPVLYVSTDNATVEVFDLEAGKTVGVAAARGRGSLVDNVAFIRGNDVKIAGDAVNLFDAP